jgi:ribosomal protein S18 acetylase RimI-like enzyme
MVCIDLQPEDKDRLHHFYISLDKTVTDTFRPFPETTLAIFQKHLEEAKAGHHISIGLDRSTGIVGHGFIMNIDKPHPVFGIGIKDIFHGKGWGRMLMRAVFEKAGEREVKHMALTVLKHNNNALSLYRSFGFKVVTDHTFKVENDSYLMQYEAGAGSCTK